jgi:hypothetical protein
MRRPALLFTVFLLWLPASALAGRGRPGPKETPAQQRANKARKDRARYGADAKVERLSMPIGGGRLRAIRVERGGLLRERVRSVTAGRGGEVRTQVIEGEGGTVVRSKVTRAVRAGGGRFTESEVLKVDRRSGRRRASHGSSFRNASGKASGAGWSQVREPSAPLHEHASTGRAGHGTLARRNE